MKLVNLAKLRNNHDLAQLDLAIYLGVHVTTYSKYETGKAILDANQLIKLANLFETSIDYILGRKKIVRVTTFENIDGEFKEVPTISEQIHEKLKKG
jgi:transcriptional regulator with XRE-family HTH domain